MAFEVSTTVVVRCRIREHRVSAAANVQVDQITCADATLATCQNVLRHVAADDLSNQTPCKEFTVAQAADHLVGSIVSRGRPGRRERRGEGLGHP